MAPKNSFFKATKPSRRGYRDGVLDSAPRDNLLDAELESFDRDNRTFGDFGALFSGRRATFRETIHTSVTHPLRVDFVSRLALAGNHGRLGMTMAPGKEDPRGSTASWKRDMAADVKVLADYKCTRLVSLVETAELARLKMEALVPACAAYGIEVNRFPIVDDQVPLPAEEHAWGVLVTAAYVDILHGKTVIVHCRGGLGRAGTFAACVLRRVGWSGLEAINLIRASRARTIQTKSQEDFIERFTA